MFKKYEYKIKFICHFIYLPISTFVGHLILFHDQYNYNWNRYIACLVWWALKYLPLVVPRYGLVARLLEWFPVTNSSLLDWTYLPHFCGRGSINSTLPLSTWHHNQLLVLGVIRTHRRMPYLRIHIQSHQTLVSCTKVSLFL